ncbi:MAG: hypothetical protein ACE5E1_10445, partial [Phycisphaerae bacterium]
MKTPQDRKPTPRRSTAPEPAAFDRRRNRARLIGLCVLLLSATLIAFGPALDNQFLNWDDDRNFLTNEAYRGFGIAQWRWAWKTYHLGVWQPLSWMLIGLQYKLGGHDPRGLPDPAVYHRVSLALHAINTIVFFFLTALFLRVAPTKQRRASRTVGYACAAAAALLFAVHPLRVEPVAWVSAQPYLPAVLFYMLAVLVYVWGRRDGASVRARRAALPLAFVCYCLAVGSKAVAVTLPAILLILDVYPLRNLGPPRGWLGKRTWKRWAEKIPFFLIALLISQWAAEAKEVSQPGTPPELNLDAGLAQAAYGLLFYPLKTLAPTHLMAYYKLPLDLSLLRWPYGAAAGCVAALCVVAFLARRRWPGAIAAWLAYIVILLPNLGLIPISQQIVTDRYAYLAMMPIMVLFAAGLRWLWSLPRRATRAWRPALVVAVAAVAGGWTAATRRQSTVWHDSVRLWTANLAADPRCAHAECMLGQALGAQGRYVEATAHLQRAIRLRPDFSFAYSNLGTMLLARQECEQAARRFEQALKYAQQMDAGSLAKTHAGLAIACHCLGRDALAWKHIRKAQKLGLPPEQV